MVANIATNPFVTTVAQGMFNTVSVGLRQGTVYPEPGLRWQRRTGILAAAETLVMWGGVGIFENIPGPHSTSNPSLGLGVQVGRATALIGSKALAGFSVFDGANGMVTTPQGPVPVAGTGMQVQSYRLGSGMRLAVQCDPILVDLQGDPISSQVSWDFVNQLLIPYTGTLTISSGTYNTTTGLVVLTMSAAVGFSPGDAIEVSGLTGTGANLATLNGTWTAIAPTSGTTITFQGPTGEGAIAITGGSLVLGSGSDVALPCALLDIMSTNCEVVEYNPAVPGLATWNYNGAAAIIQL